MSTRDPVVLAIDCGAGSARVMAATLTGDRIHLEPVARVANGPVADADGTWCWSLDELWQGLADGIRVGLERQGPAVMAVGACTWGVDYVLCDDAGSLVDRAISHRDPRTNGWPERLEERLPAATWWQRTGIRALPFNTAYQLCDDGQRRPAALAQAARLLTIPDWLHVRLGGAARAEWTNASTTQLARAGGSGWDEATIADLELPRHLFAELVRSGQDLGPLAGFGRDDVRVIAPACHDTASAVAALPVEAAGTAFISCGTWSLMGTVVERPVLSETARLARLSNELAWDGRTRLLENIMGLWVLQQWRQAHLASGGDGDYDRLDAAANAARDTITPLGVDDPRFFTPHSQADPYPARIAAWYREHDLEPPDSPGTTVRAIYAGLAAAYARCLAHLERAVGARLERIALLGGGCRNRLLAELTARACQRPVGSGPVEATAMGNALVQFVGLGLLSRDHLPAVAAASAAAET